MSATATGLAGIGWIYFNECSASFFRFAGQHVKEIRPGRVTDTLPKRATSCGKAVVMQHAVDIQIFNRNQTKLVNNLTSGIMTANLVLNLNG